MAEYTFTEDTGWPEGAGYPKALEDWISRVLRETNRVVIEAIVAAHRLNIGVTVTQRWDDLTYTVTAKPDPTVPKGEVHYPEHAWCTNGPA